MYNNTGTAVYQVFKYVTIRVVSFLLVCYLFQLDLDFGINNVPPVEVF